MGGYHATPHIDRGTVFGTGSVALTGAYYPELISHLSLSQTPIPNMATNSTKPTIKFDHELSARKLGIQMNRGVKAGCYFVKKIKADGSTVTAAQQNQYWRVLEGALINGRYR